MKLPVRKISSEYPVSTAGQAVKLAKPLFPASQAFRERCWALLLDGRNRPLCAFLVSAGGYDASVIDHRMVCRTAIERGAYGVILVHNHPDGIPEPSRRDIEVTKRLKEMFNVLGITFCDHIILGDGRFFSFEDNVTVSE